MAIGQLYSQRTGYAVHALCYMARKPPGTLTTAPELAEWMRRIWPSISRTYLSNVIQRLARGGILQSYRGVLGGYSLARDPEEITLKDVVILLEGVSPARCGLSLGGECPITVNCGIKKKLWELEEQYLELLGQTTIASLAKEIQLLIPEEFPESQMRAPGRQTSETETEAAQDASEGNNGQQQQQ